MEFLFSHLAGICLDTTSEANLIYNAATTKRFDKFCVLISEHDYDKKTMSKALAISIVQGNFHAVHKLINVGTDINKTVRSTNRDVFYLMRRSVRFTPLLFAIDCGYRSMVKLLLQNGADPNGKGKDFGGSDLIPLEEALYFGNISVVRDLIKYGADVSCIYNTESGESVIHEIVKFYKSIDVIGLLMRNYKADINMVSCTKQSLLHFAIRMQSLNTARYFINLGIDVNLESSSGDTALDHASCYLNGVEDSIKKRIVKLRAAGCYVSKKNLMAVDWESPFVKSFYEKCSWQIELMKKTRIGESNLTLYNVLHKCDYKLTLAMKYIEKDVIVKSCCAPGAYLYKKTLKYRLLRAIERRDVLVAIEDVVFGIFYGVLPHTFVRKLFYLLTTAELEIVLMKN